MGLSRSAGLGKPPAGSVTIWGKMLPSNRRFGALLTTVLVAAALHQVWRHGAGLLPALLLLAGAAAGLVAWRVPQALGVLNLAWFRLGQGLGRIVSPLVLGVIWLALLTPVALLGRLLKRDELRLRRRPGAGHYTHWIDRDPPGPATESFKRQF